MCISLSAALLTSNHWANIHNYYRDAIQCAIVMTQHGSLWAAKRSMLALKPGSPFRILSRSFGENRFWNGEPGFEHDSRLDQCLPSKPLISSCSAECYLSKLYSISNILDYSNGRHWSEFNWRRVECQHYVYSITFSSDNWVHFQSEPFLHHLLTKSAATVHYWRPLPSSWSSSSCGSQQQPQLY